MRVHNRKFTYPVLSNFNDDYVKSKIESSMEAAIEGDFLKISVHSSVDNPQVQQMIQDGLVDMILHVECSTLFYRTHQSFDDGYLKMSLPLKCLNNRVELNIMLVATEDIHGYRNDDFNWL